MYQPKYAVLGYLGYKICALSRHPDADQCEPVANNDQAIQTTESTPSGNAPSACLASTTGIVAASSSSQESKSVIEDVEQPNQESEASQTEIDDYRTCYSSITEVRRANEKIANIVQPPDTETPSVKSMHPESQLFPLDQEMDDVTYTVEVPEWEEMNDALTIVINPEEFPQVEASEEKEDQENDVNQNAVTVKPNSVTIARAESQESMAVVNAESEGMDAVTNLNVIKSEGQERSIMADMSVAEAEGSPTEEEDGKGSSVFGDVGTVEVEGSRGMDVVTDMADPEKEVLADVKTMERKEIICQLEQARPRRQGDVSHQEIAQETPSMSGDGSIGNGKPAYQYGFKFERTHRQQLSETDVPWTTWQRSQLRRPKLTRHPFLAFKNAMWWQVRAEMPQLNTRSEIMLEVSSRWHQMPEDAKRLFKDAVRLRATRVRSETGQFMAMAQDRIRRLNQMVAQGWNGESTSGLGAVHGV